MTRLLKDCIVAWSLSTCAATPFKPHSVSLSTISSLRAGAGIDDPPAWSAYHKPKKYADDEDHNYYHFDSDNRQQDVYREPWEQQQQDYPRDYQESYDKPDFVKTASRLSSSLPPILTTGNRSVGFGLMGSGGLITLLGISLFFNKTLLRLGNLLFLSGVPVTLGPSRTAQYFLQREKSRATSCLVVGIVLVFYGFPVLGMLLELFGLLNLFGNMFPLLTLILRQVPGIGALFQPPAKQNKRTSRDTRREYGRGSEYDDEDDRYKKYY
jgi:Got1/Sft2-like family